MRGNVLLAFLAKVELMAVEAFPEAALDISNSTISALHSKVFHPRDHLSLLFLLLRLLIHSFKELRGRDLNWFDLRFGVKLWDVIIHVIRLKIRILYDRNVVLMLFGSRNINIKSRFLFFNKWLIQLYFKEVVVKL